jgi:hypothetical protein
MKKKQLKFIMCNAQHVAEIHAILCYALWKLSLTYLSF